MPAYRINRISEEIKRELGEIIRELKDPRIGPMLSVLGADVTKDLRYAKVYVSMLGNPEEQKEAIEGLNSAAGFIRKEIGRRVQLRNIPEFIFVMDNSIEQGVRISKLLNDVLKDEKDRAENEDTKDEEDTKRDD